MATLGVRVLDSHLENLARKDNKTIQAVETVMEQCEAFNSVPDSLAIQLLNGSLNYQEKLRNGSDLPQFYDKDDLVQEYLCGYTGSSSFLGLSTFGLSKSTTDNIGKCLTSLAYPRITISPFRELVP